MPGFSTAVCLTFLFACNLSLRAVLCCAAEAYDVLHVLGGLSNDEIATVFAEWNTGELQVGAHKDGKETLGYC